MNDQLIAFINKYLGVANTGNTPENRGQCVGLIEEWLAAHGAPRIWGNAADLLANADSRYYKVVHNEPDNSPPPGAIVVWDKSWGNGDGHTAVVVAASSMHLAVFEQNNPAASPPTVATHGYGGVAGWILLPANPAQLDATAHTTAAPSSPAVPGDPPAAMPAGLQQTAYIWAKALHAHMPVLPWKVWYCWNVSEGEPGASHNNPLNIPYYNFLKPYGATDLGAGLAGTAAFPSVLSGVTATLHALNGTLPFDDSIRNIFVVARKNPGSYIAQLQAIEQSQWASSHYYYRLTGLFEQLFGTVLPPSEWGR